MAISVSQHDSDSSDGDSSNYTTTNILLGYASKEPTNDSFSQLGGTPIWPSTICPPSSELARCKKCNVLMTLLVQLFADLPDSFPGHERRLYVFSCKKKACRRKDGSMRVIRGTKVAVETQKEKGDASLKPQHKMGETRRLEENDKPAQALSGQTPRLGDSIFNSAFSSGNDKNLNPFAKVESQASACLPNDHSYRPLANPFAPTSPKSPSRNLSNSAKLPSNDTALDQNTSSPTSPKDLAATFAEKARITPSSQQQQQQQQQTAPPTSSSPFLPWPSPSSLPSPYPSYYLDADIEILEPTPPPSSLTQPTPAMDIDPIASDPLDKEAFESHLDKTFQTFADRVAQNPEQVLRYEFGGAPLLYSSTDSVGKMFSPHTRSQTGAPSGVKVVGGGGVGGRGVGGGRMPVCGNCGSGRVFECQLMPGAITALEAEEEGLDGMEWGSVVVGVCGRDCTVGEGVEGGWGWVEEWCGVQWEEIRS